MYSKSKIYMITDNGHNKKYYGSTIQSLSKRFGQHKEHYLKYKSNDQQDKCKYNSFLIFNEYGIENCKIVLVEKLNCQTKEELHKKESEYIKNNECVNKTIPGRTYTEWYNDNKEDILEYHKKYYEKNKDKIRIEQNDKYKNNDEYRSKILEQCKQYRLENKEIVNSKLQEKIMCECGKMISKRNIARHKKDH